MHEHPTVFERRNMHGALLFLYKLSSIEDKRLSSSVLVRSIRHDRMRFRMRYMQWYWQCPSLKLCLRTVMSSISPVSSLNRAYDSQNCNLHAHVLTLYIHQKAPANSESFSENLSKYGRMQVIMGWKNYFKEKKFLMWFENFSLNNW